MTDKCRADAQADLRRRLRAAYWQGVREGLRDAGVVAACLLLIAAQLGCGCYALWLCLMAAGGR